MNRPSGSAPGVVPVTTSRRAVLAAFGGTMIAAISPAVRVDATPLPGVPGATPVVGTATAIYRLDVHLDTERRQLDGTAAIVWRNTTGRPQDHLFLRCYANAPYYSDGGMTVSGVRVDGDPVPASPPGDDPTVLAIPLGRSVAPDSQVTLDLAFTTTVPTGLSGSFGIFGIDAARGTWALADWYPILAGWEPERQAWYLDAPTPFGDPTFPESASYDLTLETPPGFVLAHTGALVSQEMQRPIGRATPASPTTPAASTTSTTWHVRTGMVREFAMMLLPEISAADGTLVRYPQGPATASPTALAGAETPAVTLLAYADEAIPDLPELILDTARSVLPHYAALLGPLDETGIAIASAHLAGANGVSWPGLIGLDLTILMRDGVLGDEERPGLRFTVAHEVAHQWIGGLLGLNSNDHGFMLEGFANALAVGAIRETWGPQAAIEAMGRFVAGPYSGLVRDGRDAIADQPLTSETNTVLRSLAVYGKGGLGFEAIRQAVGNDAWRAALATFAERFRNRIFTPAELRMTFAEASRDPETIATLWAFWFEEATTTLPDIDPIVQGAGS